MNENENKNDLNNTEKAPETKTPAEAEKKEAAVENSAPQQPVSRRRQAQAANNQPPAKKTKKKNKKFGPVSIVILVVCALVFVGAVAMIIKGVVDEKKQQEEINRLKREDETYSMEAGDETEANQHKRDGESGESGKNAPISEISLDEISYLKVNNFEHYKEINSDMVAWLYLPGPTDVAGLPIDMSVVQTTDNAYYLDHTFYKNENVNGWLFADYENDMQDIGNSYNSVFYGHARSDNMFGGLKYLNDNPIWYENGYNHFIKITTPTEETVWQVFSWYETRTDFYYIQVNFNSGEEFVDFANLVQSKNAIKDAAGNSVFQTFEFTPDSRIITLSTCKGLDKNVRVAMHAVLVKSQPRQQ